jgi:type I restriction enzyme, S subunit
MKGVWPEVSLGEVCELRYGKALPEASRAFGDVAVFGSNGTVGWHDKAITDGPTIIVGRKGSFGEVHFSARSCWPIDTTYYVDQRATKADLKWLSYRMSGLHLTELNRAAAVPGLNREDAYRQRLLLPPLSEQRRIAEILDQAEELRSKRRRSVDQLETLANAIFIDMFGDPSTNPRQWPQSRLGDIATFVRGITFKPEDVVPLGAPGSIACLRTKNVQSRLALEDVWAVDESFVRRGDQTLQAGDTLVSSANSWNLVGKCCWVPQLPWPATFGGFVSVLRSTTSTVSPVYLYRWFSSAKIQAIVRSFGQKTTSISNLNLERCRALPIAVPPASGQEEYGRRLVGAGRLRMAQEVGLDDLTKLTLSLRDRAFRGEL